MKQKLLIILCCILITYNFSNAQGTNDKKIYNKIGITFSSFGMSNVIHLKGLHGAPSYDGDNFYTLGINYICHLNNWLEIETGLEYSHHTILIKPNLHLPPNINSSPRNANFSLLNIPLTLRAHL
jgi:hypothetical protein